MLVKYFCLAMCVGGCATVTRESSVPANAATNLSPHANVVAVNGERVSQGAITPEGDLVQLVTPERRVQLKASDVLTVRTTYRDGDTIPNEGVVRARPSAGLILAGCLMLVGGIGGAVFTAWEVGLVTNNLSSSPGGVAFIAINGAIAAGGIALIVLGILPHAHVINPYVTLAPGLRLHMRTHALTLSF